MLDRYIIPSHLHECGIDCSGSLSFNEMVDYCLEYLSDYQVCELFQHLYETHGHGVIYDLANKLGYEYDYCKPCEANTPSVIFRISDDEECIVCGTPREEEVSHA
jgi:hypothetical protein